MIRFSSTLIVSLILVHCCSGTATAGLLSGELLHKLGVPTMLATYDSSNGEFAVRGMAPVLEFGEIASLNQFYLDGNFDSSGLLNKDQKGSFHIKHGSVVLLKGTITESTGSIFSKQGVLQLLADKDVGGTMAPKFGNSVGLRINLSNSLSSLQENGFALWSVENIDLGAAEIGQAVPEPSSFFAMASALLLGLCSVWRRRKPILA